MNQTASTSAASRLEMVEDYLRRLKEGLEHIEIYPRRPARGLFDLVALAIVSKAFALSKSCLTLVSAGLADEAYGLSRSVVECSANLRYITQDLSLRDQRIREFIDFFYAEKRYWLEQVRTNITDPDLLRDAEAHAEEYAVEQRQPKLGAALKHWSGQTGFLWKVSTMEHPLDALTNPLGVRKSAYATDYHGPSAFVHCAQPALDNYYSQLGAPYRVPSSSREYHKTTDKTLFIATIYLYTALAYTLYGMGLERPAELEDIVTEAVSLFAQSELTGTVANFLA